MIVDAGLQRFNEASQSEATELVRICLDIPRWADELVSARPYPDRASLLTAARTGAGLILTVDGGEPVAVQPDSPPTGKVSGPLAAVVRWAAGRGTVGVNIDANVHAAPQWL